MTNVFYARLVLNVPRIFLSMISRIFFFSFLPRAPSQNIVLCDKLLAMFASLFCIWVGVRQTL
jgi:hypothetical protein